MRFECRHIRDTRGGRRPGSYMPRLFAVRWRLRTLTQPTLHTHKVHLHTGQRLASLSLEGICLPSSRCRSPPPAPGMTALRSPRRAPLTHTPHTGSRTSPLRVSCFTSASHPPAMSRAYVRGAWRAWCVVRVRGAECGVRGAWCRVRGAGCGVQGANVGGCREGRGEGGRRGARRRR